MYVGQVKWFDRKKGYGFITELENNSDIFVHYTQISGQSEDFRYLIAGEYVQFEIHSLQDINELSDVVLDNSNHLRIACQVSGIKGGKLMYQINTEQQKENVQTSEKQPIYRRRSRFVASSSST